LRLARTNVATRSSSAMVNPLLFLTLSYQFSTLS
jgi:hypothetical protein